MSYAHRDADEIDKKHHQEQLGRVFDIAYAFGFSWQDEFLGSPVIDGIIRKDDNEGSTRAIQVKTRSPANRRSSAVTIEEYQPPRWKAYQEKTGIPIIVVSGDDMKCDLADWVIDNMELYRQAGYYFMHSRSNPRFSESGRYEPMRFTLQEYLGSIGS